MPEKVWEQLCQHFNRRGEHFAFLVAKHNWSEDEPVFMVEGLHLVPDRALSRDGYGHEVPTEALVDAINLGVRQNASLIEVHNHGGLSPRWSETDRDGLRETVPYMLSSLPGRPYGAAVWGGGDMWGEWFGREGRTGELSSALVVGTMLRQLISRDDDFHQAESALSRQQSWFTAGGQRQLGRLRVAVVGNGGTGSHVLQNLVFLGVRDFVLVDPECSDVTSMNRLVTATAADVGTSKAALGRRLIRSVHPGCKVSAIEADLRSSKALDALKGVDLVIGCVDNDGARLVLNELAIAYGIPYFDLAAGIWAEAGRLDEAGGRVAVVVPGGPCLWCMNEIDQEEASYFLAVEAERADRRRRGYVEGMDAPAASVCSLNAAVAAVAVNELAIWISGARPMSKFTEIDLLGRGRKTAAQWQTPRMIDPDPACVQCASSGLGDASGIDRYVLQA